MRIVLVGSGNVATVLGRKILQSGHRIIQVYSRNIVHAKILADELSATPVSSGEDLDRSADICIVAVADKALQEAEAWLLMGSTLTVHTAGSVSIEALKKVSSNYGVLYPLQTLRKEIAVPPIPFLTDGNTEENKITIRQFADMLSDNVQYANDKQRSRLHLAAVIVNNFSNHLYALAQDFCKKEEVDFNMLMPLLQETFSRLHNNTAESVQTGPAARKDINTISKHLEMLLKYPELSLIYSIFSESIVSRNSTK